MDKLGVEFDPHDITIQHASSSKQEGSGCQGLEASIWRYKTNQETFLVNN